MFLVDGKVVKLALTTNTTTQCSAPPPAPPPAKAENPAAIGLNTWVTSHPGWPKKGLIRNSIFK